jgi:hypothetical protein
MASTRFDCECGGVKPYFLVRALNRPSGLVGRSRSDLDGELLTTGLIIMVDFLAKPVQHLCPPLFLPYPF